MRAELLDVSMEDYGHSILMTLKGAFTIEQLPAMQEKLSMLVEERRRVYLMDLDGCEFLDPAYLEMFLDLLNAIQSREGRLVLLFSNEANELFFRRWNKVFEIRSRLQDVSRFQLLESLKKRGVSLSKRTGIRLSTGVAVFLALLILGWIITLVSVVSFQERELRAREKKLVELENQERALATELKELISAVGPLRELGILESRTPGKKAESLQTWVEYLGRLEKRRLGEDSLEPEDSLEQP